MPSYLFGATLHIEAAGEDEAFEIAAHAVRELGAGLEHVHLAGPFRGVPEDQMEDVESIPRRAG